MKDVFYSILKKVILITIFGGHAYYHLIFNAESWHKMNEIRFISLIGMIISMYYLSHLISEILMLTFNGTLIYGTRDEIVRIRMDLEQKWRNDDYKH